MMITIYKVAALIRTTREMNTSVILAQTETPELTLFWPEKVYSLSHVAIPFSSADLLYGPMGPNESNNYVNLGTFAPRGEKNILNIPTDQLMRLRYNPFFDYMERKIVDIIND